MSVNVIVIVRIRASVHTSQCVSLSVCEKKCQYGYECQCGCNSVGIRVNECQYECFTFRVSQCQ